MTRTSLAGAFAYPGGTACAPDAAERGDWIQRQHGRGRGAKVRINEMNPDSVAGAAGGASSGAAAAGARSSSDDEDDEFP